MRIDEEFLGCFSGSHLVPAGHTFHTRQKRQNYTSTSKNSSYISPSGKTTAISEVWRPHSIEQKGSQIQSA